MRGTRARARSRHPARWLVGLALRRHALSDRYEVPATKAALLDAVVGMPVSCWSYGFERDGIRHVGPMAQDFAAAFGLGSDARAIECVDAQGVLFASVQVLERRVRDLEERPSQCSTDDAYERSD